MALSVWKYDLAITDGPQAVTMPAMSRLLRVAMQHGQLCLWALVHPDAKEAARTFVVHGTGHPVTGVVEYVGSVDDPPFVWHVFELGATTPQPDDPTAVWRTAR